MPVELIWTVPLPVLVTFWPTLMPPLVRPPVKFTVPPVAAVSVIERSVPSLSDPEKVILLAKVLVPLVFVPPRIRLPLAPGLTVIVRLKEIPPESPAVPPPRSNEAPVPVVPPFPMK